MENREIDELENAPATGNELAAPGAMSHADIVEKSKQFWQRPGCPGFEGGAPPPAPRPSSTVYAQPASNLPSGLISARTSAAQASQGVYRNISRPVELKLSDKPDVESTHD